MAEATNSKEIHEILPTEIFVNILKRLDFKSIVNAKRTCKNWKKIIEDFKLVEEVSMKTRCIIVAYGEDSNNLEILFGDFKNWHNFLTSVLWGYSHANLALHDGEILRIGGSTRECNKLLFASPNNEYHSVLTSLRMEPSVVTTETATFVFGSNSYGAGRTTYEYLEKGSTTWQEGKIPIPGGFALGGAIAINQEILLIGGLGTGKRILSFDVNNHSFKELSTKLNERRFGNNCAINPGTKKVMITGTGGTRGSTEIFDAENESITMGSPLNSIKSDHGLGVITINNEDRLVVFGGFGSFGSEFYYHVEVYNDSTKEWETKSMNLNFLKPYNKATYLSVRLGDIIDQL